jgi:nucleotide-binding universal stress UspA family protein
MVKVLFATDGNAPADSAFALLERVARREIEIDVLAVMPPQAPIDVNRTVVQIAGDAVERAREAGFQAEAHVRRGSPAREIIDMATDSGSDFIAMGAGNHPWYDRLLLGSQSTRVLRDSPCSVIIAHEPPSMDNAPILVGIDGSSDATFALKAMGDLIDPARCEVTALGVARVAYPTFAGGPGIAYATTAFSEEAEAELSAEARRHVEEAVRRLRDAGFRAEPKWVLGSPGLRLLEEAESISAHLVVVGSRGLGPIDRWVMGSVSEKMARHARATLIGRRRS